MEETTTWLTEEYLGLILKSNLEETTNKKSNGDITIVEYKARRAVKDGKNFSSILYKVEVWYKTNTDQINKKNYIIKKLKPDLIGWFGNKEVEMYKVLPKIEQYIRSKIAPKMYTFDDFEIVMDDLNEEGFQTSILKLLDYDHCEIALKTLAKFHAGSVSLHQDNPNFVEEKLGFETFTYSVFDYLQCFEKCIFRLAQEISMWPESQQYSENLNLIARKLREFFKNLPQRNTFRVLNHGDFWLNNILFKYNCKKVCDVRLIDFQICRYSPPTCDIQYFIGTCADLDVRLNRLDELYSVYLDTLNNTLADLGLLQRLTEEEFKQNLKEDYIMYFIGVVSPLAAILADPGDVFNVEGVEGEMMEKCVNLFGNFMKSKLYRKFLPPVLADLEKRGVFQRD